MATVIRRQGAAYDVQPNGEIRFGGPFAGLFGFVTDAFRGGCSGLLTFLGGAHMVGTTAPIASATELQSFRGILEQISMGGFAGPVEILGGVALFLTARRAIARTLGLLLFIGFIVAYANGYSVQEMLNVLSLLLKNAAGAIESISTQQGV